MFFQNLTNAEIDNYESRLIVLETESLKKTSSGGLNHVL